LHRLGSAHYRIDPGTAFNDEVYADLDLQPVRGVTGPALTLTAERQFYQIARPWRPAKRP
jgi:hypothetical protein